ncbi:hypothetical protein BGW80DRAFT_1463535 [Lactifluus volemus]|nr:hypothetical protein BGW80DRAFT_1463535 [Lactifluus volemus]
MFKEALGGLPSGPTGSLNFLALNRSFSSKLRQRRRIQSDPDLRLSFTFTNLANTFNTHPRTLSKATGLKSSVVKEDHVRYFFDELGSYFNSVFAWRVSARYPASPVPGTPPTQSPRGPSGWRPTTSNPTLSATNDRQKKSLPLRRGAPAGKTTTAASPVYTALPVPPTGKLPPVIQGA